MQPADQIFQFLQQAVEVFKEGLETVFRFVGVLWQWTVEQVLAVPWNQLDNLPLWKVIVLVVTGGGVGWMLWSAARILIEAGEKAITHFIGLVSAFVRTLIPILFAGALAAGGAWIVNNINFSDNSFEHFPLRHHSWMGPRGLPMPRGLPLP